MRTSWLTLSPCCLGSGPRGNRRWVKPCSWMLREPPAHPQALATPENTLESRACQARLPESQHLRQASKARARRQAVQRASVYLSVGLHRPESSLKTPNSSLPTRREAQAGRALDGRRPQGLVQRGGEGRHGEQRVRTSLSALPVLPTSSLRTDHILLLCGQRWPGAGEGGRALTK